MSTESPRLMWASVESSYVALSWLRAAPSTDGERAPGADDGRTVPSHEAKRVSPHQRGIDDKNRQAGAALHDPVGPPIVSLRSWHAAPLERRRRGSAACTPLG